MIYHITTKTNWEKAIQDGFFTVPSLEKEGFIHASKASQVARTFEKFYKNQTDLVLLEIAEEKITAPLLFELASSVNETFPHIYGKLNIDAVVKTSPITEELILSL